MPNAATFDDDLGYRAASRKSSPRKPRSPANGKTKRTAKRRRFDTQRIARFAAVGMAATMALGIMVNALLLQKGHHPAPLFGKAVAPVAATAPLPVRAPRIDASAEVTAPTPVKARKSTAASRDADPPVGEDAIGRLLAGGPAPAPAAKAATKVDGRTVMNVQRALTKLGFKVPATGAAGLTTRKAIEAFEQDRHMAVKGEVDHRLVKVLAAESGIKID